MSKHNSGFNAERRRFFKIGLVGAASLLLAPAFGRAAEPGKPVDEKDPMATALGYVKDAKKVDVKKFPKRAGAEGKTQFCENCQFYAKKDAKTGACQIFAGGLVAAKGWCNSWTKKA
ncbi:MAG: high-potential iron-sulfur protein [Deltaproteobacteria bacterium]|nr:high-potential iron-sulfur protein [Deltaproteobacteria bacterium]